MIVGFRQNHTKKKTDESDDLVLLNFQLNRMLSTVNLDNYVSHIKLKKKVLLL